MDSVVVLMALCALAPAGDDLMALSATLSTDSLEVGKTYEIEIRVGMKRGWLNDQAGMPSPILQIQVPPSAQLDGRVLESQRELSKNEYLLAPFERMIEDDTARVKFKLIKQPAEGEHFSFNVLAYARTREAGSGQFIRKRMELPLIPKAEGHEVPATTSDWGEHGTLEIGDNAASFNLPKSDGSKVALDSYLGKKNVIVTTYRAFW